MCRWPVLHMALLMVIVCIGLLLRMPFTSFQMLSSQNSHTLPFSFRLYQIWGPFQLSIILFYLNFTCLKEDNFWINFDVFGKNFIILRVSGWNIICKYYLNACVVSAFFLEGNAVFIFIIFTLHTYHSAFPIFIYYNILCVIFCWHLSRIMFGYCSKLNTI